MGRIKVNALNWWLKVTSPFYDEGFFRFSSGFPHSFSKVGIYCKSLIRSRLCLILVPNFVLEVIQKLRIFEKFFF